MRLQQISLRHYLCLKLYLFLAMSPLKPASSFILTVHVFSRLPLPVMSVLAGGGMVSDGSSLANHILPLQLQIHFRFHAFIAFHFCKSTHQSGTDMKEANSSFCDSFSDINHSLWFLMSCMWLTAPSFTLKHKPVKSTPWLHSGNTSIVLYPLTFFVLVFVAERLSRKRRHGFFYFALPTFVILSIIICTALAEAPTVWNLRHWSIAVQKTLMGWWESTQYTNTQTKGDGLKNSHSDGENDGDCTAATDVTSQGGSRGFPQMNSCVKRSKMEK